MPRPAPPTPPPPPPQDSRANKCMFFKPLCLWCNRLIIYPQAQGSQSLTRKRRSPKKQSGMAAAEQTQQMLAQRTGVREELPAGKGTAGGPEQTPTACPPEPGILDMILSLQRLALHKSSPLLSPSFSQNLPISHGRCLRCWTIRPSHHPQRKPASCGGLLLNKSWQTKFFSFYLLEIIQDFLLWLSGLRIQR